jgi:hypothetical protein
MPTWTVPIGGGEAAIMHMLVTPQNAIIVIFREEDCAPSSSWCMNKLSPEGDVLWSRPVPLASESSTVSTAMSPNGDIAIATGPDFGPLHLIIVDQNGDTVADRTLTEDSYYQARDLCYDAQGSILVAGDLRADSSDYEEEAWAARFDEQGNAIWFQIYDFDSDHGITGIATGADGKVFAVGWEDAFAMDVLGWSARGWVAELAL